MKVKFELPTGMEMKNLKTTPEGMEWDVVALRGQSAVSAGYVTVLGASGRENKAVLRVNVRTGAVQALRPAQLEQVMVDFDLSPAEVQQRKEAKPRNLPALRGKEGTNAPATH